MTFEDTLATWLVKQRWFAGKGRTVHDLAIVADTETIPGDPGLRQLIVSVSHGATSDCYQLFVGYRARLPARLRHAPAPGGLNAGRRAAEERGEQRQLAGPQPALAEPPAGQGQFGGDHRQQVSRQPRPPGKAFPGPRWFGTGARRVSGVSVHRALDCRHATCP